MKQVCSNFYAALTVDTMQALQHAKTNHAQIDAQKFVSAPDPVHKACCSIATR